MIHICSAFQVKLQSYESKYTRDLQNNIIKARETTPTDLINLLNDHSDGPFNDLKVVKKKTKI